MNALIERTLQQIVEDVMAGNLTAIEELMQAVPTSALTNYLPEGDIYTTNQGESKCQ